MCAPSHPCGKTKSHRVCIYICNSHALILSKFRQLFWNELMLSRPKEMLSCWENPNPGAKATSFFGKIHKPCPGFLSVKNWNPGRLPELVHPFEIVAESVLWYPVSAILRMIMKIFPRTNQGSLLLEKWCQIFFYCLTLPRMITAYLICKSEYQNYYMFKL